MPTDQPIPPRTPSGNDNETTDPGLPSSPSGAHRRASPPRDMLIGKVLDQRYRIIGLLARGGMGRVYRAEQAPLGRTVAVKVLDVGLEHDDDQEFRTRFIREAETSARLTHPNTVRIFDYGKTWDDVLYIAMEYLEGRNLYQAIQTDAPMDARRVARIGRQIASSLREAHGLGLIHRDLKPSNVILTRPGGDDEFVKVVDFGLVKEIRADSELTRDDALVGSPSYMSPEQIRSAALDERSDIYSLGVLLYACLTGRAPFTGATSLNVLMGHLNQPPPPMASVCASMNRAPALEAVVMRCLAKAPDDRYASMEALLQALQAIEETRTHATPVSAEPTFTGLGPTPGPAPRPPPPDPSSEVSLILPRPGPSARLIAGIGVGAVLLFASFAAVLAAFAWYGMASGPAAPVPASVPVATPAPLAEGTPPTPAPPVVATPEPPAATPTAPSAARAPQRTRSPSPSTAPSSAPSGTTKGASDAGSGAASPGASAPAASPTPPAPDTPPAAPPVTQPATGGRTGSDVRDPWEKR